MVRENLIGIVLAQNPKFVAPYGAFEPIFGTSPIAISIPGSGDSEPVTLDMATSAYALFGLLEEKTAGAIRVFDRSHKSFGLALMVELLAGGLSGSAI